MRASSEPRWRPDDSQRGSITVEFALLLPAFLVVLSIGFGAVLYAAKVVSATGVSSHAARMALTADDDVVGEYVEHALGKKAQVEVRRADGWIDLTVSLPQPGILPTIVSEAKVYSP